MTQRTAADRFARANIGGKLAVLTLPSMLLKLGSPFSAQAHYGWSIGEALNNYLEAFAAEQAWADLGQP